MLVRLGLMPDVLVVVSFHGIWIMIVSMHVSVLVLVLLAIVFVFVFVLWTHLVHLPTGKRLQVISAILCCVRSVPPAPLYPLGSS